MSYPVLLADLMDEVRLRTNVQGLQKSFADMEIIGYINQSLSEWYDEVISTTFSGQRYRSTFSFVVTPPANLTSQVNPVAEALPADFYREISVDVYLAGTIKINGLKFQEEERNMYCWWPIGWVVGQPVYYQLWGGNLVFLPAPQGQFQCQLNYIPIAPKLFSPNDTFDSINGWEEWVICDAAIKVALRDGQFDLVQQLTMRRDEQRERIRMCAASREGTAERIHETARYDFEFYTF